MLHSEILPEQNCGAGPLRGNEHGLLRSMARMSHCE